ncbi:MAG: GUN4 domain-containing protein, partial [Cyanobacteriota bacterium]|nr:GUN4 domain-containing protein [Cyanobacteriota bacterium]
QTIFDNIWIEKTVASLRPYAGNFRRWVLAEKQDDSWLLRENALVEAEAWTKDKSLGFQDLEFLAASRKKEREEELAETERLAELERERKEREAAEKARLIEAEAKQEAEKQLATAKKRMQTGTVVLSISLGFAVFFGITAFIAKQNLTNMEQNLTKVKELSEVASHLQQINKVNEANQSLNIAGLVLQDKIKNQVLKEALLNSSLVLGYKSLVDEKDREKKKEISDSIASFKQNINDLSKVENQIDNNPSNLATLVYIYYVKGQLAENSAKALSDYKKAFNKYNLLYKLLTPQPQPKLPKYPVELFKLDLNILYNGNADIVAALHHKLRTIDSSNTAYTESLKQHLLNELNYLMQEKRWREADEKNWQFILTSAGREIEDYLGFDDIKNFKCEDLKKLDRLWVKNSQGHFGYSVQNKIYLSTGNSLDFDWENERFRNWNKEGYVKFAESVGWVRGDKLLSYSELSMSLSSSLRGELPVFRGEILDVREGVYIPNPPFFLERLVNCSR